MAESWIEIGRVISVNPARREIRVEAAVSHEHEFADMHWVRLTLRDGEDMRCRVVSARKTETVVLIELAPGVTRDNVGRMKYARVVIAPDEVRPRPAGAYDMAELMGMAVECDGDPQFGTITEVYATPANAAIEITRPDGTAVLVPVTPEVVADVQIETRRVVVRDIERYMVEDED